MRTVVDTIQVGIREWELQQPVSWNYWHGGMRFDIPVGYRFDLASVPRGLWWLIAPFELSTLAPLIHDYLFELRGRFKGRTLTRKQVDKIFLQVMKHEEVSWWRRTLAYYGVRLGGWFKWHSHPGRSLEEINAEIRNRLSLQKRK